MKTCSLSLCLITEGAEPEFLSVLLPVHVQTLKEVGGELVLAGELEGVRLPRGVKTIAAPDAARAQRRGLLRNLAIRESAGRVVVTGDATALLGPPDWPARLLRWARPIDEGVPYLFSFAMLGQAGERKWDWVKVNGGNLNGAEALTLVDHGEQTPDLAAGAGYLGLSRAAWERSGYFSEARAGPGEELEFSHRAVKSSGLPLVFCDAVHGVRLLDARDGEVSHPRSQVVPAAARNDRPTCRNDLQVAIVFDDRIRPDTTGVHCLRALREIAGVRHFLPSQRNDLPREGIDIYLQIDDGTSGAVLRGLHPSAFWAIDTHLQYERLLAISRDFDYVFCAQRPAVARMERDGIRTVRWLPLAASPFCHYPVGVAEEYDVSFVGHRVNAERDRSLETLNRHFPKSFIGTAFGEDLRLICSGSRVLFNRSVRGDLNMRVFESLAMGKPLVTDALSEEAGLFDLFEDGVHLVTYEDGGSGEEPSGTVPVKAGFAKVIGDLLADPLRRRSIGEAGRELVLGKHTYRHRMEEIIEVCGVKAPDRAREGNDTRAASPRPRIAPEPGLVSIIIPCKDGADFTRSCLESIARETSHPYEVIAVDNGSRDDTPALLEEWSGRQKAPAFRGVRTIENRENLGFARAINQGVQTATGSYVLLLNNDVIVSREWLSRLVRAAESDQRVGLAGPRSNYAAPPQLVENVTYGTLDEFRRFAEDWARRHDRNYTAVGRLTGFCLLIKREAIDAVGELDERFAAGFFEDDDLSLRARRAGFILLMASDVYIHHYGSQTFKLLGVDIEAQLKANYGKFRSKWGDLAAPWKFPDGTVPEAVATPRASG